MIHLDTSFLIRALALGSPEDRKLRGWIGEGQTPGNEHRRLGRVAVRPPQAIRGGMGYRDRGTAP